MDVTVNVDGNPATTEFCINESSTGKYIQSNGTLGNLAVWQTAAAWGTKTVTGLATGVTFTFQVKARNSELVETPYGATTYCTTCTNPTGGGTISADQTLCSGETPTALGSVTLPSGFGGTLEYKWQLSSISASADFSDIAASNSANLAPHAMTSSTWYKRLSRVDCKADWSGAAESNVIAITVNPEGEVNQPADLIICNGSKTTAVIFSTNNTDGATSYSWINSNSSIGLPASGTGNIASFMAVNPGSTVVVATIQLPQPSAMEESAVQVRPEPLP